MRLVYGFGINDLNTKTRINGKETVQYMLWRNMIGRCYSERKDKTNSTYKECFVSDEFRLFSDFCRWFDSEYKSQLTKPMVDKDFLIKSNKVYSPSTCIIIPPQLNNLIIKRDACRGNYPLGVSFHKGTGKLTAQYNDNGKRITIGYFDNEIDAFMAYKTTKENHIKKMANAYKNVISEKAYNALMSYKVEITD